MIPLILGTFQETGEFLFAIPGPSAADNAKPPPTPEKKKKKKKKKKARRSPRQGTRDLTVVGTQKICSPSTFQAVFLLVLKEEWGCICIKTAEGLGYRLYIFPTPLPSSTRK